MPRTLQELTDEMSAVRREFEVELETVRARYLGKGGRIDGILGELRDLSAEDRRTAGTALNQLVAFMKGTSP